MYSFDSPFLTLVAFRVDGPCWASLSGVYTKFSGRLSEEPFPWLIQKFPCTYWYLKLDNQVVNSTWDGYDERATLSVDPCLSETQPSIPPPPPPPALPLGCENRWELLLVTWAHSLQNKCQIWVGPASLPSLWLNFDKIVPRSGQFQILFWRLSP